MDELLQAIQAPDHPAITTLTGPMGIGKTTRMARLRTTLDERGVYTVTLRFTPHSADVSPYLPERVSDRHGPYWPVAGEITPAVARSMFAAENTVVLIDDAQWIDPASLAALEQAVRESGQHGARCVCAVRLPAPTNGSAAATLRRLHRDGLLSSVRMRVLSRAETAAHAAAELGCEPDPALVTRLRARTRGVPAALCDAVDALNETGAVRFVAGRAHHNPSDEPASHRRLIAAVLELGPDAWATAKAAAILHPLGRAVPALVAEALDRDEDDIWPSLSLLREAGILHRGAYGESWRFPVPLVATALADSLGPYERRHLAKTATTALWHGRAEQAPPDCLPEQIANAGQLIEQPSRARHELLAYSRENLASKPKAAAKWLRAAADLAIGITQHTEIMVARATALYLGGDTHRCVTALRGLLDGCADRLSDNAAQSLRLMLLLATHGCGDVAAVSRTAVADTADHGTACPDPVTRAVALALLDRWPDATHTLTALPPGQRGNVVAEMTGAVVLELARYWCGHTPSLDGTLPARGEPLAFVQRRHRPSVVNVHAAGLLATGSLRSVEKLLIDERTPEQRLNPSSQALLAAMRGSVDTALELGQRCMATEPVREGDPARSAMVRQTTDHLVASGRLGRARTELDAARADSPVLAHLLDCADAHIEHALGNLDRAQQKLTAAVEYATARELVVGLDLCYSGLAQLALVRGDHAAAAGHLRAIDDVARRTPTGRASTHALLVRATVDRDTDAADTALRTVRERGQPFETARVMFRLVHAGVGDPELLPQAYRIFGELGALLDRAWTRNLMSEHDIPIPGRRQTVAENEQLLGLLVTEGLSNKQLARVLGTTNKSVEGRLSRLFARTGMHSRIELANALLAGS